MCKGAPLRITVITGKTGQPADTMRKLLDQTTHASASASGLSLLFYLRLRRSFPEECENDLRCRTDDAFGGLVQIKLFEPQNPEKSTQHMTLFKDDQIFIFQNLRALVSGFQSIASFLLEVDAT